MYYVSYAGLACRHAHPTIDSARNCLPRRLRRRSQQFLLCEELVVRFNVIVAYIHPPIPLRSFDYCACYDEELGPYGWGETRERAIDDLRAQEESSS